MNTKTKFVASSYSKLMHRADKFLGSSYGKNKKKPISKTEVTIKKTEKYTIKQGNGKECEMVASTHSSSKQNHNKEIEVVASTHGSSKQSHSREIEMVASTHGSSKQNYNREIEIPVVNSHSSSKQYYDRQIEIPVSSHSSSKPNHSRETERSVTSHSSSRQNYSKEIEMSFISRGSSIETTSEREIAPYEIDSEPQFDDDEYDDSNDGDEELVNEPDISKLDYYCKICDAHMNSLGMWDAHISGKRHIKNKKKPTDAPVRLKSLKAEGSLGTIHETLKEITDPVVGLNYVTEIQRNDGGPVYNCYLCKTTVTPAYVLEHILSARHMGNYVKHVDPDGYAVIETFELSRPHKANLITEKARLWEETNGRGKIEIKTEMPRQAPRKRYTDDHDERSMKDKEKRSDREDFYPSYKKHRKNEDDDLAVKEPRAVLEPNYPGKQDMLQSPPPAISSKSSAHSSMPPKPSTKSLPIPVTKPLMITSTPCGPMTQPHNPMLPVMLPPRMNFLDEMDYYPKGMKLQIVKRIMENFLITSEAEEKEVEDVKVLVDHSLMQFKIKKLPRDLQRKLAAQILADDDGEDIPSSTANTNNTVQSQRSISVDANSEYENGRSIRSGLHPSMAAFPTHTSSVFSNGSMYFPMVSPFQDPNMPPMQGLPLTPMHYPSLPFDYNVSTSGQQ